MTDPDMGTWQYDYDLAGNLVAQRDPLYLAGGHPEHQIIFQYDNMNRITAKFYGVGHSNAPDVQYYYDDALGDAGTRHSWGRLCKAESL